MSLVEVVVNYISEIKVVFDAESYLKAIVKDLDITAGYFEYSFVNREIIVEVNQSYLERDYVTDIITFTLEESPLHGDVYICLDQVQDNAKELGNSFEFELKIVMIHGALHLLGYTDYTDEDRATMDRMQLEIFNRLEGCG